MRVLHVGKFYPPFAGGMEIFTEDLCRALCATGHQVQALVHASRNAPAGCEQRGGVEIERVPVATELVFTPISPGFPRALSRRLRELNPQVLHLHMPNPSAFWTLLLPAARRIPWVIHWHSDVISSPHQRSLRATYPFYRPFERALLRRAARIIVTSAPYLESSAPLARVRARCTVVPLGVDPQRLGSPAATLNTDWPSGSLRLLAVGRLTYYKGYLQLLEAVARTPYVVLLIVGTGQMESRLQQEIARLGLSDRVRLLGGVEDSRRNQLLNQCDVLCLPSLERTEAFGLVLLEAMALGKPTVVSDIPGSGAPWVTRTAENGLLVPPGDTAALADALARLAADVALRHRLGTAGQAMFATRFRIDSVAESVAEIYRDVTDGALRK